MKRLILIPLLLVSVAATSLRVPQYYEVKEVIVRPKFKDVWVFNNNPFSLMTSEGYLSFETLAEGDKAGFDNLERLMKIYGDSSLLYFMEVYLGHKPSEIYVKDFERYLGVKRSDELKRVDINLLANIIVKWETGKERRTYYE